MLFSRRKLIHRLRERNIFNPFFVSILRILHLVHDEDCVPIIVENRFEEGNWFLDGIHGQYHILARYVNFFGDL